MSDRLRTALRRLSIAFLIFLWGFFTATFNWPLNDTLSNVTRGARQLAYWASTHLKEGSTRPPMWYKARGEEGGVTRSHPERMQPGVTLYLPLHEQTIMVVDAKGEPVHRLELPFDALENAHQAPHDPEHPALHLEQVRLLDDGSALVMYKSHFVSPTGHGLALYGANGQVQWSYIGYTHHDFTVLPSGNVLTLTHDFTEPTESFDNALKAPVEEDFLIELDIKTGEPVRRISLVDAVLRSPWRHTFGKGTAHAGAGIRGDILHTNAVRYLDASKAAAIPDAEPGDVLVSMRNLHALGVLNLDEERFTNIIWGPWRMQHDPSVLANGNILLFDNRGAPEAAGTSRVLEFDPETGAVVWQYQGTTEAPLETLIHGAVERLDNGNTLITESDAGRLVEVTREGEIVWEYYEPSRAGEDGSMIPSVWWARRLSENSLPFADWPQATTAD